MPRLLDKGGRPVPLWPTISLLTRLTHGTRARRLLFGKMSEIDIGENEGQGV